MKKILLCVILLVFSFFVVGCSKDKEKDSDNDNLIRVIQYKIGTEEIIKEIKIEDADQINEFNEYLAKIEPLKMEEQVDLALAQEISIVYNDNVSVNIQKGQKGYCYYVNKENNVSSLSKIPEGMYDFVEKILNLK